MTFWSCPVRLVKHQFKNTCKQNHCPPNTSFSFYHFVWLKFRPNSTGNQICVVGTETKTKTINNVTTEYLMETLRKPQRNFDYNCCWSVLMLLMTKMTCSQFTHTRTHSQVLLRKTTWRTYQKKVMGRTPSHSWWNCWSVTGLMAWSFQAAAPPLINHVISQKPPSYCRLGQHSLSTMWLLRNSQCTWRTEECLFSLSDLMCVCDGGRESNTGNAALSWRSPVKQQRCSVFGVRTLWLSWLMINVPDDADVVPMFALDFLRQRQQRFLGKYPARRCRCGSWCSQSCWLSCFLQDLHRTPHHHPVGPLVSFRHFYIQIKFSKCRSLCVSGLVDLSLKMFHLYSRSLLQFLSSWRLSLKTEPLRTISMLMVVGRVIDLVSLWVLDFQALPPAR